MAIQWFPGHMNTARREVGKALANVDVIIELVDARMPEASRNPMITELRKSYRGAYLQVFNKADLADPAMTQRWIQAYQNQPGSDVMALSGNRTNQVIKIPERCLALAPHRNSRSKPLRMMILGIPNVGKSTLMNTLLKRPLAKVGNEPAVTRQQQRHNLNDRQVLIDAPGLLWPKITDPKVGLMLAVIHAVGPKAIIEEEVAEFLAEALLERYPGRLMERFGCEESEMDGVGVLEAIARKRGCRKKGTGGQLDIEQAATILLTEFRKGKLGRISLETPNDELRGESLAGS